MSPCCHQWTPYLCALSWKRLMCSVVFVDSLQPVISSITGVPEEHVKNRLVHIFMPAKNAMQSGTENIGHWMIEFETRERWENPLMGWSSTGDPLSNLKVEFKTQQDAIDFCEKNGWKWMLQLEQPKTTKLRPYAQNFSWNKRTRVSTK